MNCKQLRFDCQFCSDTGRCALLTDTKYYRLCPFYVSKKQFEEEREEINRYVADRKFVGESNTKLRLPDIRRKHGNPNRN